MSKFDYLHELYLNLKPIEPAKRNEIMQSVEQRFLDAEANQLDYTSVIDELGSPESYATELINGDTLVDYSYSLQETTETEDILNVAKSQDNMTTDTTTDITENNKKSNMEDLPSSIAEPMSVETDSTLEQPQTTLAKPVPPQTKYSETENHTRQPRQERYYQPTPRTNNSPVTMIFVMIGLFFLNIILLGPFVAVWSVAISLLIAGVAIAISSVIVIIGSILATPLAFVSIPIMFLDHPFLIGASGFLLLGIGGLLTVLTIYFLRFITKCTIGYGKWNLRAIRGN